MTFLVAARALPHFPPCLISQAGKGRNKAFATKRLGAWIIWSEYSTPTSLDGDTKGWPVQWLDLGSFQAKESLFLFVFPSHSPKHQEEYTKCN